MTRKVSKIFLYVILGFVLLAAGTAIFTQTSLFRSTLRSTIYTLLEKEINANIYIGEINGNLFTGFSIDTVMMYVDGAPFIEAGKLSVHYRLISVLRNKINIDSLKLENPIIHLTRWKNGDWNVDHLSKSTTPDDSTESSLIIVARKLQITNARFHLIDSTGDYNKTYTDRNGHPVINYSNLDIEQVDLEVNGIYTAKTLDASIKNLSFIAKREQFTLTKFSAEIIRTEQQSSIKKLVVVTPLSRIEASVELKNIDVFTIKEVSDLRRSPVVLQVSPSNIVTDDIQKFLPSLDFMKGNVLFEGEFEGNFENLSVKRLHAEFGKTSILLSGSVSNIYQPDELRLNIVSSGSVINPPDVPMLMPYFGIPEYNDLGLMTIDFQFVGKPLDFLAISKIKSAAGTVTVDGQMVITEENIHYKGILAGNDVKLEKVFSSNEFLSRMNTRIFIEGEGTSLATLNTEATIEIDSSSIRNIQLNHSKIELKAHNKIIDADVSVQSPSGNISAQALVDFSNDTMPSYNGLVQVRGLDLAPIINDEHYSSQLSFDITRSGKGLTLFDTPSDTKIDFYNSNFHGMSFDSAHVMLAWLKDSVNNDKLIVSSPIVDGEIEGTFTFNDIVNSIQTHLKGFDKIYRYQRGIIDSSFVMINDSAKVVQTTKKNNSSLSYNLRMKNLKPLSILFKFPELDIFGSASGTIWSDSISSSSSGTISISNGLYADTSAFIQVHGTKLDYSIKNISPSQTTKSGDPLEMHLNLVSDEIGIADTKLRSTKLDFDFDRQHGDYTIVTDIDTTISISAQGSVEVSDFRNQFTINDLYAKYQGLDIRNATTFIATATPLGIQIDTSVFVRGNEEFIVKGKYNYRGSVNANVVIKRFALSDIFFVNTSAEFREQAYALGGLVDATATLSGTVEDPVITAQLEGTNIAYRNSNFGNLDVAFRYAKKNAGLKVELNQRPDSSNARSFNLEGNVPIDLSFTSIDDRTSLPGMNITITTENLPAEIFDIFIPEIDQMSGLVTGEIAMTGSLKEPMLQGNIQLANGLFRLEMTGIQYSVNGKINLDSQKIKFPEFIITNTEKDYSPGLVNVGGFISMKGFSPSEYHLSANGELLVLSNASRSVNQSFFGTLIAQTGSSGLRFEGTFERSRIRGEVLVNDASLIFPQTQQTSSFSNARFDDVVFYDDTSKIFTDTTAVSNTVRPFTQNASPKKAERTFLDGFGYELTIQTQGNVNINMIFNANAGAYEALSAELNGKMVLNKDEFGQQLIGTINVSEGSNYKFYKEFKASGSLTFVGDPQNPQLNIIAKYEGTHCKNTNVTTGDCLESERVIVRLEITGSRLKPKVKIGLVTLDQNDREIPRQGDIENDAVAFLLTSSPNTHGQFREDLSAFDRNKLGEKLTSTFTGTFINSMLSDLVMEFVKQNNIPFVKRIEVRNVERAEPDLNISGEFLTAVFNVGGNVLTDLNNANISVQYPILGKQNRSFMAEVERKTENFNIIKQQITYTARLFYRFTF
ncbi:MAG TPA: hypothetical protein DCQ28_02595 [Bacteroidetes bacterium]|nr:hypothetical protein [Bacteroidota bacterium]